MVTLHPAAADPVAIPKASLGFKGEIDVSRIRRLPSELQAFQCWVARDRGRQPQRGHPAKPHPHRARPCRPFHGSYDARCLLLIQRIFRCKAVQRTARCCQAFCHVYKIPPPLQSQKCFFSGTTGVQTYVLRIIIPGLPQRGDRSIQGGC